MSSICRDFKKFKTAATFRAAIAELTPIIEPPTTFALNKLHETLEASSSSLMRLSIFSFSGKA
ncbi:MAG: hypothetical protein NDI69_09250 [Bacteriovoracaceae bacterium]|nr:hypothetical protein [Bacteriovoracaceae bacterium]